jgi:hypothetical protein
MNAAYATRSAALATAWANTDATARRTAVKAAWESFKKSATDARKAWQTAKKNAWSTFKTGAKTCTGGSEAISTDASGESMDQ